MAIFANAWTGRRDPAIPIEEAVLERQQTATIERPAQLKSTKLSPKPSEPMRDEYLTEYATLAKAVGVMPPDLGIEKFKAFLHANDIPVFSLAEVVAYLDDKAARESKDKAGWEWRPLRERDHIKGAEFGKAARRANYNYPHHGEARFLESASDYYVGPRQVFDQQGGRTVPPSSQPYDKTIPLHALRKVAAIDKEFAGTVALFVCDYAPAPAVQYPDPFLMAVIDNPRVKIGTGRFVIDFWDEPGFGIDRMLKR